jgi:hypothetical protein
MHGIESDDAVGNLKFAEQLPCGGNVVGFVGDVDMDEDQAGCGVECVQHLGCLAVVEIVETSPKCLPIGPRRLTLSTQMYRALNSPGSDPWSAW